MAAKPEKKTEAVAGKSAKEAYMEFQRQADALKSSRQTGVSLYPPQFPASHHPHFSYPYISNSPYRYGTNTHRFQNAGPEQEEALLDKVGEMLRLGLDFINASLAGGLSLMEGVSPGHGCERHMDTRSSCHGEHHHDHSGCSCDSCHDCCCQPAVNGCC